MTFTPSPAVRAYLSLRMDAAHGTPTIWEKIAAKLGFGAAIGMTPDQITATVAGDNADITKGEQDLLGLFQPSLVAVEQAGASDLVSFLKAIAGLGSVTSVSQAANIVNGALAAEGATLQKQAIAIGQTGVTTLLSAALSAAGKINLPLAG
jgi:hypothetical protein